MIGSNSPEGVLARRLEVEGMVASKVDASGAQD
jgi:hypothetical protein